MIFEDPSERMRAASSQKVLARIASLVAFTTIASCSASSQETPLTAKSIKTQRITQSPTIDPMVATDDDGRLLIDWAMAETLAASSVDPRRGALARLMLAIRDRQWKPMSK